jgi:hypothetical protein
MNHEEDAITNLQNYIQAFANFQPTSPKLVLLLRNTLFTFEINDNQLGVNNMLLGTRVLLEVVGGAHFYQQLRLEDETLKALPEDLAGFLWHLNSEKLSCLTKLNN